MKKRIKQSDLSLTPKLVGNINNAETTPQTSLFDCDMTRTCNETFACPDTQECNKSVNICQSKECAGTLDNCPVSAAACNTYTPDCYQTGSYCKETKDECQTIKLCGTNRCNTEWGCMETMDCLSGNCEIATQNDKCLTRFCQTEQRVCDISDILNACPISNIPNDCPTKGDECGITKIDQCQISDNNCQITEDGCQITDRCVSTFIECNE